MTKILMACLATAVLILDSRTAFSGAVEGIDLCIRTVIPSLFPFFVLSILLTSYLSRTRAPILRPIGKLFGVPSGAEIMLLTGYLGGYPVGAQGVSQTFDADQLSRTDAQRMTVICNNCGPAFLFGMAAGAFDDPLTAWMIWGIIILSGWILSIILPKGGRPSAHIRPVRPLTYMQSLDLSIRVLARVCGWIILFRILLSFLDRWILWYFPQEIRVVISGIFELANGCTGLKDVSNEGLRFMICTGLLSFGGLCVTMQTFSVISPRLDKGYYFPGKAFQGCISVMLAYLVQLTFPQKVTAPPWIMIGFGLISAVYLLKKRKKCSIPAAVGV